MCTTKDCKKFFKEFDDKFLHNRTPQIQRDINTVLPLLEKRRNARAAGKAVPKASKKEQKAVKRLADEQLKVFKKFFTKNKKLDFDCIQSCFAKFANGELRQPPKAGDRPGEPNGPFYFYFAEFATLAIEGGFDAAIWTELLRTFVKTQEIFIEVYPPRGGAGPGGNPLDRPRRFKGPKVDKKKKKKLHDKYKKKSLKEILDCYQKNLKKANAQTIVAFAWPPRRERQALVAVSSRVDEVLGIAHELLRSGELTATKVRRWRAFGTALDGLRDLLVETAENDTGRTGWLGEISEAVPGILRGDVDDLEGPDRASSVFDS